MNVFESKCKEQFSLLSILESRAHKRTGLFVGNIEDVLETLEMMMP